MTFWGEYNNCKDTLNSKKYLESLTGNKKIEIKEVKKGLVKRK
ncbi:hypothetical protein P5E77_03175 [Clostridium perfringens]|nr:hypothetical protein [Clostridium perfringens]